ncbi:hypothetical protein [Persephonella sp.]|uniref:hypothetical protein n=1 Tax=Persephonella sp. TaxID=2060922 RepID=UPI0026295BAF|nr:hypothetical protein [Persephonella sp.]
MKIETVKMKSKQTGGKTLYYIMRGQVIHPKDNPEDYKIELGKRKTFDFLVVVGSRGVYILDRDTLVECAKKSWLSYLEKYKHSKRKGEKAKGNIIKHPIVIYENTIRETLKERGYDPCDCRFIDLVPDRIKTEEEAEELLDKIIAIVENAKKKAEV